MVFYKKKKCLYINVCVYDFFFLYFIIYFYVYNYNYLFLSEMYIKKI